MNKKLKITQRKRIKNYLPKYDFGTYGNLNLNVGTNLVLNIGQGVAENGVQKGNLYVKTARLDSTGTLIDTNGLSAMKTGAVINGVSTGANIALLAGTNIASGLSSAKSAGSTAGGAGGATSGSAGGIAGAVTGALTLGKGIFSAVQLANDMKKPIFTDDEYEEMKGELTLSGINGVEYKQKTGVNVNDVQLVADATGAANTGTSASVGAEIGGGIGGTIGGILAASGAISSIPFVGWILGPILAAVGASVAAGVGAAGSKGRSDKAIAQANQVNLATNMWNQHEESVANSQGMREVYQNIKNRRTGGSAAEGEVMSADYGKSPYGATATKFIPTDYTNVATSRGINREDVNAIVGRDEIISNANDGTAYVVDYGKKGSEENVYANLKDSDAVLSDNPNMIIPGTDMFIPGGLTPAKAGRESAEFIYNVNKAVEKNSKYRDAKTLRFLQEQADKVKLPHVLNLKMLTDIQDEMKNNINKNNIGLEHAKYGRSPKSSLPHFDNGGWADYLIPSANGLISLISSGLMYKDAKNEEIEEAPNIYHGNQDAVRAIQNMKSHYNSRPEELKALDINKMLLYANRHAGYNPGLRMSMDQSAYANYANLMLNILANALNQTTAMHNEKQKLIADLRDKDVTRQMENNKYRSEYKRQANAAKQKRVDQRMSELLGNTNKLFENLYNGYWGRLNLKMYQDNLKLKKEEIDALKELNRILRGLTSGLSTYYNNTQNNMKPYFKPLSFVDPFAFMNRNNNYVNINDTTPEYMFNPWTGVKIK